MDSNASDYSTTLDTIRKTSISRRGGVRVRGGRLPPIRMRDLKPSSTRKVIAPKIPQRRIKKEQESWEPSVATTPFFKDEQKDLRKPFSRGRGQRVYIQTEGSFLEQGPAFRLKKETMEPRYERSARSSSRTKSGMDNKINSRQINLLLEGYDENDVDADWKTDMQPVQFPYIKKECQSKREKILDDENSKPKIKQEILDDGDVKLQIKEEILDDEDVKPKMKDEILDDEDVKSKIKEEILDNEVIKPEIKKEPEEDICEAKGNLILPEVKTTKQETSEAKIRSLMEAMKLSQEEDVFLLFQLPSCLPFKRFDESSDETRKNDTSSTVQGEKFEKSQNEIQGTSFKYLPEGSLGKLQITKSGRMRLALREIDIAIESLVNEGSTSEVVSISLENENGGHFTVLGKIYQKMVMCPISIDSKNEIKIEGTSE